MPPCGVPLRVLPYRQSSMYPALSILDTRRSSRLSRTFSDNIGNRTLWSMLSKNDRISASRMKFTFVPLIPTAKASSASCGPLGSKSVREPEKVFLVDRVQHRNRGPLDDLVLKGRDRGRALPPIRLRNAPSPGRQGAIRSPLDPCVQILDPAIEVGLVVLPGQPVHAGRRFPLEREKRHPEHRDAEMVEERGELLLLPCLCHLPYAVQHLGHAFPVLRPARALLARIPLGLRPWLHRLRGWLPGLVRRLLSYYGWCAAIRVRQARQSG